MSEMNHSPENPKVDSFVESSMPVQPQKKSWLSYFAGTVVLLVVAAICLQFFNANTAVSQTEASGNAGKATLSNSQGKVLAKVNNQSITYEVVARECVAKHGEEVLENLINRLIIQQECDRQGITISRGEVEQEVVETAKKFNLPIDSWYQMLASERGLTKEQYHDDVIWPMIALKKLAGKKVQVTEKEMQEGFDRDYGPRMKGRMILLEGNVRQASQVWEKCVASPEDFDRFAREHSTDPNSRALGGVIPPIRKNAGNKTIEDAAFKLQTGEISGLVQIGENSYVIIKCEGMTEPVVDDIRVVWNDLLQQLTEEKTQRTVAEIFEQVKKEARVDNFLTRTSTKGQSTIQQTSGLAPSGSQSPTINGIGR